MNTTKESEMTTGMAPKIQKLIDQLHAAHEAHATSVRCPSCGAGIGKWCIGNERLAGPTDPNPSCKARLALVTAKG